VALSDVNKTRLPTFREWLEKHSPGTQGDDFEAFADLTARTQGGKQDLRDLAIQIADAADGEYEPKGDGNG